jgi:hypothetical protein
MQALRFPSVDLMHLHTVNAFLAIVVAALAATLVKTCVDLLDRGPYEAPLLSDDGLAWHRRSPEAADDPAGQAQPWSSDRESSAH